MDKLTFSKEFSQATNEESLRLMREMEEKMGERTDDLVQFHHVVKAHCAIVKKEQARLQQVFNEFMHKYKDGSRAVFVKGIDFYMDCLSKCDYAEVLAGL